MSFPAVTVVLPVYNCPAYVGQAIESMLAQSLRDHELIVIDDGSTDETPQVLQRYRDPRIVLLTQQNKGLAATLNRGIATANGRYIARQDQDDFSHPDRLAKQVDYLDAHPSCGLVGTWAEILRGDQRTERQHRHPCDNAALQFELLLNNPFVHSSVMVRKEALDRVGVYSIDKGRQPPEDFELWSRIARSYQVGNLPEVLHSYREVAGSMSRDGVSPFLEHLVTITAENIALATGRDASDAQAVNIAALFHGAPHRTQGQPDFAAMRDLFVRAADRVAGAAFRQKAAGVIEGARYRHALSQRRSAIGRLMTRLSARIGRIARRTRA